MNNELNEYELAFIGALIRLVIQDLPLDKQAVAAHIMHKLESQFNVLDQRAQADRYSATPLKS